MAERNLNLETNLVSATVAGTTGAIFDTTVTYPLEYLKVSSQLHYYPRSPAAIAKANTASYKIEPSPIIPRNLRYFFDGASVQVSGNALKAILRISAYNYLTKQMADENGKTTPSRVVSAGFMVGLMESLWIVPFECVKTGMIENSMLKIKNEMSEQAANPVKTTNPVSSQAEPIKSTVKAAGRNDSSKTILNSLKSGSFKQSQKEKNAQGSNYKELTELEKKRLTALEKWDKVPANGVRQTISQMYELRGTRAFVQGFFPTLLRQAANSAVRFSSYNAMKQLFLPKDLSTSYYDFFDATAISMLISLSSSALVVLVTQPVDVVKTRMQSKFSHYYYRSSSLVCLYATFKDESWKSLWRGSFHRFVKIGTSGAITMSVYELVNKYTTRAMQETPFSAN